MGTTRAKSSGGARVSLVWLVAGFVLGCDPLADAGYFGEPLLTLRGDVAGTLPEGVEGSDVSVALVWLKGNDDDDEGFAPITESAVVEGGFPARYRLDLFHPPPADATITLDDGTVQFGFIVAFPGADAREEFVADDVVGIAAQHLVVYVANTSALAPLAAFSPSMRGAQVGFNLVDVLADRDAYDACIDENLPQLEACEVECQTRCPVNSGCLDGCLGDCAPFSDAVRGCRDVIDAVVAATNPVPLTLGTEAVEVSNLLRLLAGPEPDDETNPDGDPDGDSPDEP